eukprot:5375265-Alexandrium_andersonii.AAC.1
MKPPPAVGKNIRHLVSRPVPSGDGTSSDILLRGVARDPSDSARVGPPTEKPLMNLLWACSPERRAYWPCQPRPYCQGPGGGDL